MSVLIAMLPVAVMIRVASSQPTTGPSEIPPTQDVVERALPLDESIFLDFLTVGFGSGYWKEKERRHGGPIEIPPGEPFRIYLRKQRQGDTEGAFFETVNLDGLGKDGKRVRYTFVSGGLDVRDRNGDVVPFEGTRIRGDGREYASRNGAWVEVVTPRQKGDVERVPK
jgi:hypothetical protein